MRSKSLSAGLTYSTLFFLSGATGLVYELLWVRVLYQSFGSTIQSVTTVVAAYMGGLGLGAWLFGRLADRSPRPARLYGWLEIAIGVFGVVSPLVLALVHRIYLGTAGALAVGGGASVALRFGLAALVLLIPTTLMGGTLPILTRAFMGEDREQLKGSLSRLYGLNTLGAVIGTALAGFFLIEFVGVRASLWATAAVNLAIGAIAIRMAGPERAVADPGRELREHPAPAPAGRVPDPLRTLALTLLALTAFASLLDEIAWTRVLVMVVGGSTYAFTLVLLVFLLGIGLGSMLVARRRLPRADTAAEAALAQGITGVGAAGLFLFFGLLPTYIIAVFQIGHMSAIGRLLMMGVAVGGVVLIPAIGMGMTFPLLTDLVAREREARGADVGAAYALNTLGSILGAVLTGFVLVATLGTQATLRVGLVINGLAALALAVYAARGVAEASAEDRRLRVRVLTGGVLGVMAFVAAVAAPGWSTRLIDLGPTIYARGLSAGQRRLFLEHRGVRQLAFHEGPNATVSVWEGEAGRSLRVNGKVDASDRGDMDTQVMLGLGPLAARAGATSAFVIGYGSGATARVVAAAPGMQRVRIVELEPAVLEMDTLFRAVNDAVLSQPNVSVVVDDARSALQLDPQRYDVIISEPSNPWVAGIATLYTPEFFRIAHSRLTEGGVFAQWIQLYQLPLPVVAGIVRSMREVFPHTDIWFGEAHDLFVVGSDRPLRYDAAWLELLLGRGGPLHEVGGEWLFLDGPEGFFGRHILSDSGAAVLAQRSTFEHHDDRPRLEFVAARSFLDPGPASVGVFDSLVAMGGRTGDVVPIDLIRVLGARRSDQGVVPYLDAARRAQPREPEWPFRLAGTRLVVGDTARADSLLRASIALGPRPDALLLRAQIATQRKLPTSATMLRQALAAGADTAQVHAALALLAVRDSAWDTAIPNARIALERARGTFRHPHPIFLGEVLTQIALNAPAARADSLLRYAAARRPGSARYRELAGVAALRAGRCEDAAADFIELLSFGVERDNGPELVEQCRAGQHELRAARPPTAGRR